MIIAVDDSNLPEVAKELKLRGYKVVNTSSGGSKKADALVYSDNLNIASGDVESASELGVFLINGKGKTTEEIEAILNRKCYSSLF